MGNIVKRFANSDVTAIPAQRCSCLSIGTSRLDKCACIDNGISVAGETASPSNGGSINGCKAFCEEAANEGMHMTLGSTKTKGCLGDIDLFTLPMVHTRPSGSGGGNNEGETPNGTVHADVQELGCVDHSEKSGLIYSHTAGHMCHNLKDESAEMPRSLILDISKDSLCKVSPEGNSFRNPNLEDDVGNSPATDAKRGQELILHGVYPADGLFDLNVCEELADGTPDLCYKSSAEVSLEGQGHEKRTQCNLLNYDVVPIEVITACTDLDVSNPKSSLKQCAKQKRTTKASSPACANLDASNPKSSLKGRAKQKRTTKASSPLLVPKENVGTLVPSHLIGLEIEEQPTSPLVGQNSGDEVLQGTPRSRMAKTPLSYVRQSRLTRRKGNALSISTPESVKMKQSTPKSVEMKRSRSGRRIVPRLDPGSQNIIYDPDGSICGIANLEAQFPQGISSAPPSKRSRRLSPIHNRLLTL